MITTICILAGLCIFEAYLIIMLFVARHEERKYTDEIQLIDLVTYEKDWRDIHE